MTVEDRAFDVGEGVSRETLERLQLLESLVKKWNPAINLVSKDSLQHLRERHIDDSVQLFNLVTVKNGVWCDLGSGGGFPGLVIAILSHALPEHQQVKLVESDGRKAVFLREAIRQLGVEATVVHARIESLAPLSADVLSARALAGLSRLCEFAHIHLAPDGRALFPKGSNYEAEILDAQNYWTFDLTLHPSRTDSSAAILELRNIRHV